MLRQHDWVCYSLRFMSNRIILILSNRNPFYKRNIISKSNLICSVQYKVSTRMKTSMLMMTQDWHVKGIIFSWRSSKDEYGTFLRLLLRRLRRRLLLLAPWPDAGLDSLWTIWINPAVLVCICVSCYIFSFAFPASEYVCVSVGPVPTLQRVSIFKLKLKSASSAALQKPNPPSSQ